ncbi:MAG TPA: antibiotic biosynthesis monooxygenase [Propionibacteriaceae bacterium]|nr:antibiotic biosynthesis monooxygenase [Propionibacteriaceae bacterium]
MVVVTAVKITVVEGSVDAFVEATLDNHRHSVQEPGNLRFDVLASVQNPNEFMLYEVFASQVDADAHKETDHYLRWRERVAPMMAAPRVGVPYAPIAPAEATSW